MTDTKTLRIERSVQAPAEAVFDPWTSPYLPGAMMRLLSGSSAATVDGV